MPEDKQPAAGLAHKRKSDQADPLARLATMLAELLAPGADAAPVPGPVEVELQAPPDGELQVELRDDALTVRGAVLTIRGRRLQREPVEQPQKYYY